MSDHYPSPWRPDGSPPIETTPIRTDIPHSARMYDYYLGGKTNFGPDRAAADEVGDMFPEIGALARTNRQFLTRAVRYLTARGVEQFLDIGTGIPTSPAVHETAREDCPHARVVYCDNDPIVLTHARALLDGTRGATAYVHADLRDPADLIARVRGAGLLDISRPIGVLMCAVLHFLPDTDDPRGCVRTIRDWLPAGSHLVVSHVTGDYDRAVWKQIQALYRARGVPGQVRSRDEIAALLEGLDPVRPGLVPIDRWGITAPPGTAPAHGYGAVARVP